MTTGLVTLLLSIIGELLTAFLIFSVVKIRKENKANKEITIDVARGQMITMYESAKVRGYTTKYQRIQFGNLHDRYKDFGKNGFVDDMKDKFFDINQEN